MLSKATTWLVTCSKFPFAGFTARRSASAAPNPAFGRRRVINFRVGCAASDNEQGPEEISYAPVLFQCCSPLSEGEPLVIALQWNTTARCSARCSLRSLPCESCFLNVSLSLETFQKQLSALRIWNKAHNEF